MTTYGAITEYAAKVSTALTEDEPALRAYLTKLATDDGYAVHDDATIRVQNWRAPTEPWPVELSAPGVAMIWIEVE